MSHVAKSNNSCESVISPNGKLLKLLNIECGIVGKLKVAEIIGSGFELETHFVFEQRPFKRELICYMFDHK